MCQLGRFPRWAGQNHRMVKPCPKIVDALVRFHDGSVCSQPRMGSVWHQATQIHLGQQHIAAALAQLPEEYRTAIVLRHVADLDYEEIAAIQGVPIGTVRSRLARGRAQLAEILGNQNAHSDRQTKTTTAPPEGSAP